MSSSWTLRFSKEPLQSIRDVSTTPNILLLSAAVLTAYLIIGAFYRVFFSRISHLPGPKLAAVSYFYQFYYDVWPKQGRWMFKQRDLHEQYGPIVRVGPDEVHILDPDFYSDVFGSERRRRNKSKTWYWFSGSEESIGGSTFATLDHDAHHRRRAALAPFFSKRKVQDLEGRIKVHAEKMKERLLTGTKTGEVFELLPLASALMLDVVSEYCFGRSTSTLSAPELGKPLRSILEEQVQIHPIARQFPTLVLAMLEAAQALSSWLPMMKEFDNFNKLMDGLMLPVYDKAMEKGIDVQKEAEHSIIGTVALNSTLPPQEKRISRIRAEAFGLIGAGTETTSRTLSVGMFHILSNPAIHSRLLAEIRTVVPTASSELPSAAALGQLPYLTAVIHESMRIAHGITGRLVRIAPDEDLHYGGYTIPSGTTFSMTQYLQHTHPEKFPDPFAFKPERFLGSEGAANLKYLVPFSKGPRMCIGNNIAWAALYLTVPALVGSIKMELVDTTVKDVTIEREYFLGLFPADSKGVRVKVLGPED